MDEESLARQEAERAARYLQLGLPPDAVLFVSDATSLAEARRLLKQHRQHWASGGPGAAGTSGGGSDGRHQRRLVVGLDVEWKPTSMRGGDGDGDERWEQPSAVAAAAAAANAEGQAAAEVLMAAVEEGEEEQEAALSRRGRRGGVSGASSPASILQVRQQQQQQRTGAPRMGKGQGQGSGSSSSMLPCRQRGHGLTSSSQPSCLAAAA